MADIVSASPSLLGEGDAPSVQVVNAGGAAPLCIVCDHASNAVPAALNGLGLPPAVFGLHIAWDIGAAGVATRLARRLDAPAVLAGYSRLVIDCNRQPGDPGSIVAVSDGIAIPGNQGMEDAAAEQRVADFFWPYHHAITAELQRLWRHGPAPALIAVHSFTPRMNGQDRPWHVGVLWNRDPRIARPLLESLRAHGGLVVGDNQPYCGRSLNFTLDRHAGAAGLPHVSIEIRQDLIGDDAGMDLWADILAECLTPILALPGVHEAEMH